MTCLCPRFDTTGGVIGDPHQYSDTIYCVLAHITVAPGRLLWARICGRERLWATFIYQWKRNSYKYS